MVAREKIASGKVVEGVRKSVALQRANNGRLLYSTALSWFAFDMMAWVYVDGAFLVNFMSFSGANSVAKPGMSAQCQDMVDEWLLCLLSMRDPNFFC